MALDMGNIKLVLSPNRPKFEHPELVLPRTLDPIDHETMMDLRVRIGVAWFCKWITDQECVDAIAYTMWLYEEAGKDQV